MDFGKLHLQPTSRLMVSIPHAGERIPPETPWLRNLPEPLLMYDVDRYVDRLYQGVIEERTIPCVKTPWHRYAADLNRLDTDIDCDSVMGSVNPSGKFPRGFHWSMTTAKEKLMPGPMSAEIHATIVEKYYLPFHKTFRDQQSSIMSAKGCVYHLDLHSMPSLGTAEHRDPGEYRADVVISDCKGTSCSTEFLNLVMQSYAAQGLTIKYNWPYFGGRLTEQYGQPKLRQNSIQVELNRALYMDEKTKQLDIDKSNDLIKRLSQAVELIWQKVDQL